MSFLRFCDPVEAGPVGADAERGETLFDLLNVHRLFSFAGVRVPRRARSALVGMTAREWEQRPGTAAARWNWAAGQPRAAVPT